MSKNKKKVILFLISQAITLFGSSIVQLAIVWFVTKETSSGVWVSLLTVSAYLPQFIISFFSGVWADRYSRKKLIIISDVVIAIATLILALSMPYISKDNTILLLALIAISVIRSLGTGVQTPAVNAVIPDLVEEDKLMHFNGVFSAIQSFVQFASPMVAALVLTYFSLKETLFIDIATAMIGVLVLSFIFIPKIENKEENPSMIEEFKKGLKYTNSNYFIKNILILFGIFIFLSVPTGFLSALFVQRFYGDTYWDLTWVELAGFIGMALGGVGMSIWGGFKNAMKTLVMGLLIFGLVTVSMGSFNNYIVYIVLMGIYGVCITFVQTASTTLIQKNTDKEVQGRVFGLMNAIYSGFLPVGMLIFGPLADLMNLRILMIATGVLLLTVGLIVFFNKKFYLKHQ